MKYVVDIQDLWPEAFYMTIKNKVLQKGFLPIKWYMDKAYKTADVVIGVSDTYVERVLSVNHKCKDVVSVFLGNDGALFDEGRNKYSIQRTDDEIWIGYIGSLSQSYDIDCVIDALEIVKRRRTVSQQIRFFVMGGGIFKDKFEAYAKEKNTLAEFTGLLSYQEMVGRLCACNIAVNPIVKGSAASIINKVGDYALSGLPVINTQECQEYRDLLDKYGSGINCGCGCAGDVADAIEKLALDIDLRKRMGLASRKLGIEKFDRRNTYNKVIDIAFKGEDKKKIVFIANFPSRLDGSANGRFTYLAEMLVGRGHSVEVIFSDFDHQNKVPRELKTVVQSEYRSKLTMLHEPGYLSNISIKRLWSHFVWGMNVSKYLRGLDYVPDVVYAAIPSITAARQAARFCKAYRGG